MRLRSDSPISMSFAAVSIWKMGFEKRERTYDTERLLCLINLPVEQADDSLYIFQLLEQFNLAFVSPNSVLAAIFQIDLFQREYFVILCHDSIDV